MASASSVLLCSPALCPRFSDGPEPLVQRVSYRPRLLPASQALAATCALNGGKCVHTKRNQIFSVSAVGSSQTTFLTVEEAGIIEMTQLDMHERFLARLTVSSLNLLRVISEQEGVPIDELNAGLICDWFVKDKAKRETDVESATLRWESGPDW